MCADSHFAGLNRNLAKLTCQTGWLTGDPLSFTFFRDRQLDKWVSDVIERVAPSIIFVCSSNMAQYVVGKGYRPQCAVVDFADVDSAKWREYADKGHGVMRFVHAREARLVLARDRETARSTDISSFVSEPEADIFRNLAPESAAKIHAVSNGVDSAYFAPEHAFAPPFDPDVPTFVFTGTMDYPPNIDAACWFAREIFPEINQRLGSAQFFVVGANPSPEVLKLKKLENVHVTGRVPDVRPYLAHALAGVAPLRIARGIQNKVLEAMAMGKPVLATPEALEGIDDADPDRDIIVATDPKSFAEAACKLSSGEISGAERGEAARKCVVDHYSWDARLTAFDTLIDRVSHSG